jgi:hypothetical protein
MNCSDCTEFTSPIASGMTFGALDFGESDARANIGMFMVLAPSPNRWAHRDVPQKWLFGHSRLSSEEARKIAKAIPEWGAQGLFARPGCLSLEACAAIPCRVRGRI